MADEEDKAPTIVEEEQTTDDPTPEDQQPGEEEVEDSYDWETKEFEDEEPAEEEPSKEEDADDDKSKDGDYFEIDEGLAVRARELGLEPEDFASEDSLKRTVQRLEGSTSQETRTEEEPEEEEFTLDLDPDLYDEKLVETLKKMQDHNKKTLDTLKSENAELKAYVQKENTRRVANVVDGFFGKLDTDWGETFGDGPTSKMDMDSTEAKARMKLLKKADALVKASGEEDPDITSHLEDALRITFKDKFDKITRLKASKKSKKRTRVARSTFRDPPSKTGEESARVFEKQFWKEVESSGDDEFF